MSYTTWTIDQILGLAPDRLQVNAAETAAKPDNWSILGTNISCAWGEFASSQKDSYHAVIALPHMGLSCDCPSRKLPCRHTVALSILLAQRPDLFTPLTAPPWVTKSLNHAKQRQGDLAPNPESPAYQQALIAYRRRLDHVKAGLRELELWLRDMIHQGVAALATKPAPYWRQMADRLIDARAYEVAKEFRQIAALPGKKPDWPEQLLRRAGRLYLLTQGFSRYDSLAPEAQADLRFAVGWFPDPSSAFSETQRDSWLVLGRRHEMSGRKNLLRTWLWGNELKRPALLIKTVNQNNLHSRPFVTGTVFDDALQFYPSAWPTRAHFDGVQDAAPSTHELSGYRSLEQARRAYGRALSLNPWLRHYPLLLQAVRVEHDGQRWSIRDKEGYMLPLPEKYLNGWHLKRVAQTEQFAIFGEWDGRVLNPLSITSDQRWIDLHTLRGVK